MRENILVRTARALVTVAILSPFAQNHVCRAAFLNVYGGPTYSTSTGGYLPTVVNSSQNESAFSSKGKSLFFFYGAVNNAGVAVGNVDTIPAQLGNGQTNVHPSVATWSAISSPVILDSTSSTSLSQAQAINDTGTAVGLIMGGVSGTRSLNGYNLSVTYNEDLAVRWNTPNPSLTALNGIGAGPTQHNDLAFDINSAGTAVGSSSNYDSSDVFHGSSAVRWDAGSTAPTQLGAVANQTSATAYSINSSGVAAGIVSYKDQNNRTINDAVRWDAAGNPTILGNLGRSSTINSNNVAVSINDAGVAVGYDLKFTASGGFLGYRAVRWEAGATTATELGNLGTGNSSASVEAVAINNSGVTIGNADVFNGGSFPLASHAVRWDPGSTAAIELTPLSPTSSFGTVSTTAAEAINSQGLIVGYSELTTPFSLPTIDTHAVYWNLDGSVVDLNSLIDPASGWILTNATAISDTGWILGDGMFDPDGVGGQSAYDRLFLVQVPEPSSVMLLVLGITGIAAWVGRRHGSYSAL